jgi:peptidoglycan hydrolase-like protein with peptidoglycan-binding domain
MLRHISVHQWARALTFIVVSTLAILVGIVAPATVAPSSPAQAVTWPEFAIDMGKWNAGKIITDELFFDPNAMSPAGVQTFLNEKVPTCRAGYTCLKSYTTSSDSKAANPMCQAYQGMASESAANIIWKVAQACGVSPKVILVMLQKEQGLVLDTYPTARQYKYAMGNDCPDTGGCGATAGFFAQVYGGTYMLKRYTHPPGTGPGTNYSTDFKSMYAVGSYSSILYTVAGTAGCGDKRKSVYVSNQATHALYVYTPYTPNDAALAAGWGTATCGAYGNRNFFRYYSLWFGDPGGVPPAPVVAPTQTGSAAGKERVGTVLTVNPGTWKGAPAPAIGIQWFSCPSLLKVATVAPRSDCTAIPGATGTTYTLTPADAGHFVAAQVSATNFLSMAARMSPTTAVVYQVPVNSTPPSIPGPIAAGARITIDNGVWAATPAPQFSYQWELCRNATNLATCVRIKGATAQSYVAKAAHLGRYYRAIVTAKNTSATVIQSTASGVVSLAPQGKTAPALTGVPVIGSAVSVTNGTWTGKPPPSLTYRFFSCPAQVTKAGRGDPAGCNPLGDASTSNSAMVTADQRGRFIVGQVIATNPVGSATQFTKSLVPVGDDPALPLIAGNQSVGQTLSATSGTWSPIKTLIRLTATGPKFNGYPIRGIQQALKAAGYGTPITGVYSARTKADVKKFQVRYKLAKADGLVGSGTWAKMKALKVALPVTYTYQWLRCSAPAITSRVASQPGNCVAIPGATNQTYTLIASDSGTPAPSPSDPTPTPTATPTQGDNGQVIMVAVTANGVTDAAKTRWSLSTGVIN